VRIYIGADHNGFDYKQKLSQLLIKNGHQVIDEGDKILSPEDDYPQFAGRVVSAMLGDKDDTRGLLICASGQGMCMAANRFKAIRAALCLSRDEARASRTDDNANVLCLSAKYTNLEDAEAIVNVFLSTAFAGAPRFIRRLQELDKLG
jgi:ribose 5-phosphate isomerase B